MSEPIEMIRGSQRQTVYGPSRLNTLIADGWQKVSDLSAEEQNRLRDLPPMPFSGYDDMGVEDVLAQAAGLPPERIAEVVRYESATKGRVSVIGKLTGSAPTPSKAKGAAIPAEKVEQTLEAETSKDFEKTGNEPPTWAETDAPAPKANAGK